LTCADAIAQQVAGYPGKTVRIIAPYAPGGAVDALGRVLAQALTESVGKPFIVENRAGAGGNIGLAAIAKASPDGYTIGIGAANMLASNRALYKSLPFDTVTDFVPVGFIGSVPFVLVVHPSIPAYNLEQLLAVMKARSNELSYGSSGIGNTAHLFGALLNKKIGANMVHVPYKSGGEAIKELLGGRVQFLFSTLVDVLPQIEQGTVRPIALAASQRGAALASVPTFTELGMEGFEAPTWFGVIAPAGTPGEIISFLNAEMRSALAKPEVKARLVRLGLETTAMTASQFRAFILAELEKWERIVKESGARVE
jgi:tripartite-type tricarboxylate transporter receptor subunit TctC